MVSGMICGNFKAQSPDQSNTCYHCGMHRTQHSPIGAEQNESDCKGEFWGFGICCEKCGRTRDHHDTWAQPELQAFTDDLSIWWAKQVGSDIERTAPKISEYGTKDLEAMGRLFAQIRGIEWPSEVAAVWGIMFYAQGKIARAIASLERGEMPSEDTLFDLSIYAMMARSYQARGKL